MKVKNKIFIFALILSLIFTVGTVVAAEDLSFNQNNLEVVSYETYIGLDTSQENEDEIKSASKADGDSNSPLQKTCLESVEGAESRLTCDRDFVGYGSFTDDLKVFDSTDEGTIFSDDSEVLESDIVNAHESFKDEINILKSSFFLNGGDFDDIQNMIDVAQSGDTIVLNGNFVAGDSMISINKKLTITSTDGAILDGKNKVRIFNIRSNAQGTIINNLVFKNAYAGNERGGAILLNAPDIIVDNCEFYSNSALSGGAIATSSANVNADNLIVKNSKFYSNHATSFAGAILYISKNLEINSCVFESNHVTLTDSMGGGGVMQLGLENVDNNYKIINSSFSNNYVSSNGDNYGHGGVACLRRGVSFNYCNFTNNSAHEGGALSFHDGGSITNCKFYNNSAVNNGGAISIGMVQHGVVISQSYFANNHAIYGGAIYNAGDLNLNDCIFQSNRAISKLQIISPSYIKCSDDALIKVILEGGNNVVNAIWSNKPIVIDGKSVNPNNGISSQSIGLNVGSRTFISTTNDDGEAIFKFNTKNFKVQRYLCMASFSSNDYFETSKNFNLDIVTKVVFKTKIKNKKKIKKVIKYQAYVPSTKYVAINFNVKYYLVVNGYALYRESGSGVKKIKKLVFKWKNVSKNSINTKYKWYKSKYCYVTKYKATKITYKYVNGKFVKKSVNKNYKYAKNSKYKNKRVHDWSMYVLPSVDCESDNKKIIELSKKIIKNEAKKLKKSVSKLTDKQKANALLRWVQEKFKYEGYGNTRYGALKSLKMKKLNCVDSTHMTVALLRAANIPAKYNAKSIDKKGHTWPVAYFNGKWHHGEATEHYTFPKFGKCSITNKNWVKPKADEGTFIDSYKYSKKFVQYGPDKLWFAIFEEHLIEGNWRTYYVLNGNADTIGNINFNNVKIVVES